MRHAAGREHLAVEADVGAVAELDVAVLARQDRVAADEHAAADADAAVGLALGVEQAVVVDDDVVADADLVRMPQHDVLPEDDVAAARRRAAADTASCAAPGRARPARACDSMTTSSCFEQRRPAAAGRRRAPRTSRAPSCRREQLILRARIGVIGRSSRACRSVSCQSQPCARYQSSVRPMPSRRPTCGA